jgi:hypothetical protein
MNGSLTEMLSGTRQCVDLKRTVNTRVDDVRSVRYGRNKIMFYCEAKSNKSMSRSQYKC